MNVCQTLPSFSFLLFRLPSFPFPLLFLLFLNSFFSFPFALFVQEKGGFAQSTGKSGSIFMFSDERRFFLKTIESVERRVLLRMLKDYYNHMTTYVHTLILKYLGLYRCQGKALSLSFSLLSIFFSSSSYHVPFSSL